MFQKVKGLVLRQSDYRDNDRILTVLTAEAGLMTVKARGVKGSKSLLRVACDLLTYSEFTVYQRQGYHTVTEAQPIAMFPELRSDVELLALGSYFAQMAEVLAQEDSPDPELLRLILHALQALCEGRSQRLVKAACELRLAALSGYTPEADACPVCGSETPDRFHVGRGAVECAACAPPDGGVQLPVSPGTLSAMRHILSCDVSRVFRFTLGEASEKELADVAETYLLTRLERGFFTLDFYKSLQLT